MCGIAGVFGQRTPLVVEKMLRVLAHRGPDDQHLVSGEGYTIGARRLSIIDLEGGRQPLSSGDGRLFGPPKTVRFTTLAKFGPTSRSGATVLSPEGTPKSSPTSTWSMEKILQRTCMVCLLAAFGTRRRTRALWLRNRAGKKPLYYMTHDKALWFASEIKALLQVPGFTRRASTRKPFTTTFPTRIYPPP